MSTTRTIKKSPKEKTPDKNRKQPEETKAPLSQSPAPVFALPAAITIDNIEEIATSIRALHLDKGVVLTIDAAETEIVTTPGIQLLVSLSATLREREGKLLVVRPQESFVQACNALGLASQLTMGGL